MNSAVYPEEVDHLSEQFGEPLRMEIDVTADLDFHRAFKHSLQRRRAEVALVIRRADNRILVTTKAFYPAGIFRIPTGGIKPGEAVEEALWREMQEETGLTTTGCRFGALIQYRMVTGETSTRFATYLFVLDAPEGEPCCTDPDEEICEYQELPPSELERVATSLEQVGANWRSWGLWRAVPHRVAAQVLGADPTE